MLQRQAKSGYAGVSADTVGPADYRPAVSFTKEAVRCSDFGRGRGHSVFEQPLTSKVSPTDIYNAPAAVFTENRSKGVLIRGAVGTDYGAPTKDGYPRKNSVFVSSVGRTQVAQMGSTGKVSDFDLASEPIVFVSMTFYSKLVLSSRGWQENGYRHDHTN